ncbi:MAG: uracil-DNA glycosylase [Chloroflexi bacterium]|uniref:uracil-DNA glycosylase n=1 Tax=Candidatus Flexifilum breve TaxID=3140694 RepID=UPI0031370F25|nr:uracil-DNA glycosylase [Chloroflexota bacterium]
MSNSPFEQWLDRLARAETPADATNQFAYGNPNNDIRRANLRRYLAQMNERQPTVMLVGEAPGYRGSRLTGIPFGSRRVVLNGVPELGLFGVENGYQDAPEPGFERIQGEQSSTAVWGTLAALRQTPLIWAAYPYHPHLLGEPLTNRKPRRPETDLGLPLLRGLIALYPVTTFIAVGNVGEEALKRLGITAVKVRHPAQGGKNDFVRGLTEAFAAIMR